jgi:hypothetical protein
MVQRNITINTLFLFIHAWYSASAESAWHKVQQ